MSAIGSECVACWSALPPDRWGAIARAALHAEGGSLAAWELLSRVNSIWRAGLKGMSRLELPMANSRVQTAAEGMAMIFGPRCSANLCGLPRQTDMGMLRAR